MKYRRWNAGIAFIRKRWKHYGVWLPEGAIPIGYEYAHGVGIVRYIIKTDVVMGDDTKSARNGMRILEVVAT